MANAIMMCSGCFFTQTDSKVAVAPDPEVKEQVLVQL